MKEKSLEIKSMHIKYVFTEDEKKEIAAELAKKISEKTSLENKKKEVTSHIQSEINSAATAASRLSEEYNQGYTWKNTDCYEIFDYETKQVFTHREDTEEQVEVRTMKNTEYDRELFDPREEINDEGKVVDVDFDPREEINEDPDADLTNDEDIPEGGICEASTNPPKEFLNDKPV
jgi:hypothetical protein